MPRVLALTDAPDDVRRFCADAELLLFQIRQLPPAEHDFTRFEAIYQQLKQSCDLGSIDLVIAEYIESLPLLYFMRRDGYSCPALLIPHTNPYPLNILCYFLLVAQTRHPGDLVICGSANAAGAYERITGLPARAICTFGIRDIYRKTDRRLARARLGLPADRRILLYTGRFMNDKGLGPLLNAYHRLRARSPELLLAMSVTHVDHIYFNELAAQLEHVVLYQRLDREDTVHLYNSADLYVSGATSIFETYGKAPLEALACGVPVVVPNWDGFPYFIGEHNGALAEVDYLPEAQATPFDFARVNPADLERQCRRVLDRPPPDHRVPDWARYDATMRTLESVVAELVTHPRRFRPAPGTDKIDRDRHPAAVHTVLDRYELTTVDDLVGRTSALGLIDRRDPGDASVLRQLHDEIFLTMAADPRTVEEAGR